MSSSSSRTSKVPACIANGKFELQKKLGSGCFGEVYCALKRDTQEHVAVKVEDWTAGYSQLEHEAEVLRALVRPVGPQGFANIFYLGKEGKHNFLVMELLGRSLEDRMQMCKSFKVRTTVLVAQQVLYRIEYLHSKGIIHRDIKPDNFVFGVGPKTHILHLIDFGLSKRYFDKAHCSMRTRLSLTGTARYASINAHKGCEQSRRDDLEAIGHMLMYFLRGSLPWSGLEAKTKEEKYRKIADKKRDTPLPDLCRGFPSAFEELLAYSRRLQFKERPDYVRLRKLFSDVRKDVAAADDRIVQDWDFEWNDRREMPRDLVPLEQPQILTQPDDPRQGDRGRLWCCFRERINGSSVVVG